MAERIDENPAGLQDQHGFEQSDNCRRHAYLSAASWGSCPFLLSGCRHIRQALIHAATKNDMSTVYLDHIHH